MKNINQSIKKYISYDSQTGILYWKESPSPKCRTGSVIGHRCPKLGYICLRFKYKHFRAHRIAWFLHYGTWPDIVDHINGVRDDNRIENLRSVDTRTNCQNKKHNRDGRLVGTSLDKRTGRWRSCIMIRGKKTYIGMFSTEKEAHEAYIERIKLLEVV